MISRSQFGRTTMHKKSKKACCPKMARKMAKAPKKKGRPPTGRKP
jgi:hypothetical protein